VRVAAACLLAAWLAPALAAEQVVTIPTREGVTVSYLLVSVPDAAPRFAVVSFIGGKGVLNLQERSAKGTLRFGPGANFLVRVRDVFAEHARDVAAVVADLAKRYPGAKVYAMGTSRGTTSVASIAAREPRLFEGIVLSSIVTIADRTGPNLSRFDFASLKLPTLLVHNRDDACRLSPYAGAKALASRFALTTVEGGDPPKSDPCEPQSPHGYFGREAATAAAIRRWIETATATPLVQ